MKQLDTSASFLDKDDPRYHDLINRYDGFSEVLEMIRKNPYSDKSLGEEPAPIVKKKGVIRLTSLHAPSLTPSKHRPGRP